ncbi:MAG: biotin/lipoyl-binding protein [Saprospiraceae bacterium]|nr:biotin/lipoyl-binding protein [Saprospiraceae bacterium]MBK8855260.1 biotin/lipoyl-binding protein [Saprospiraceae bacterium]MBK9043883.1 biotin/lipoyl-binding protein [Saprospiraceae bacterium]
MLRFSSESVSGYIDTKRLESFIHIRMVRTYGYRSLTYSILIFILFVFIVLWMPWTQNIRAKGEMIALSPEQRPQTIQTIIAGRIEKWYVAEGQKVKAGDTILQISEVKDEYFDPKLLDNTRMQIDAKKLSGLSYNEKAIALGDQLIAIEKEQKLKILQATNKVKQNQLKLMSDSMDLQAEKVNFQVAQEQLKRFNALYEEGLKSLTELETRKLKFQEVQAKLISQENKYLVTRNELINSRIELQRIEAEYKDKLAKSRSDRFTALSGKFDTEATVSKMENQFANYKKRISYYFITAPQNGYVTKALQVGLGEIVKEGTQIVSIMPEKFDGAIQMYVKPIDLPLLQKGQKVMIQFDGWPAIVFSGWPGISYGTFMGEILAIDNFISDNQMYRVLVIPKKGENPWPEQLRVGTGVRTISFLKNVRVWYEIWRQINGFPPDYYKPVKEVQLK